MWCRSSSITTLMCLFYCCPFVLLKTTNDYHVSYSKVHDTKTNVRPSSGKAIEAPLDLNVSDSQILMKWSRLTNTNNENLNQIVRKLQWGTVLTEKNLTEHLRTSKDYDEETSVKQDDDSTDLGLPPEIANEYIDNVNPPKMIPLLRVESSSTKSSAITTLTPSPDLEASSTIVSTKANNVSKPKSLLRNLDLAVLLKAELDAKKAELDSKKSVFTQPPNLFALLPSNINANPFVESNYKLPNRVKSPTKSPDQYSQEQFIIKEETTRKNAQSTISVTTPSSNNFSNTSATVSFQINEDYKKPTESVQKVRYNIVNQDTNTGTSISSVVTTNEKQNKTNEWSLRVNNQTGSLNSTSINLITSFGEDAENQSKDTLSSGNTFYPAEDYYLYNGSSNNPKTIDYNDFDYADNTAINTSLTLPDGIADYPGASYRLTTERLAYILIGSCCALSILCLIVVAMSVRCRDMCDEYRQWKRAEKAALRWHRQQYRLTVQPDLSRYFRTSFDGAQDPNRANMPVTSLGDSHAPLYGPTCCHCINCSSSWLFRDAKRGNWGCSYYHPPPRGKLPFGAASTVNTFMPRFQTNQCDDGDDSDSLNASDLIEANNRHPHNATFKRQPVMLQQFAQQQQHVDSSGQQAAGSRMPNHRHQQLRRIAQPNGNPNWIHSSELVDELHRKHSNLISQHQSDQQAQEQSNVNGSVHNTRHQQRHFNDNIVVWNNNNDERLI